MDTTPKMARTAGLLYVVYIIMHIFSDLAGRAGIIEYANAAATAQNILESGWQFRLGLVTDLSAALLFLLAAWALYVLLKPVNNTLALLFLLLNLGGVAVQSFSNIFLISSHLLLNNPDFALAIPANQLHAQVLFFLHLHKNGFMIAQIFYGAWLFPLGYTVYTSGFLPRALGIIIMVHSAFWLMTFLQFFLFPSFTALTYVSYPLGLIAEAGLGLWLLIIGAKKS
ncbi:MAG: DUF4386 domain-containing protein [Spirochaetes bacterium]|nr:DUF4386 domain-containing protein [Spirochaetota bacterium]MBU0954198.1 DUF4386 domain-containing protein [Spirochaetota bacterium]